MPSRAAGATAVFASDLAEIVRAHRARAEAREDLARRRQAAVAKRAEKNCQN